MMNHKSIQCVLDEVLQMYAEDQKVPTRDQAWCEVESQWYFEERKFEAGTWYNEFIDEWVLRFES
jgi:hypothetical protein